MKNLKKVNLLLAFAILFIVSSACGTSNTGFTTTIPTSSTPQVINYKIGDVIQIGDSTIILNSAKFQGNRLSANFTIENNGSSDFYVSSLIDFYAQDNEATMLEQNIFLCGSGFDGSVLPSEKVKGNICWYGVTSNTVKVYYDARLIYSRIIVWEITK